jgi:hypothetical protein
MKPEDKKATVVEPDVAKQSKETPKKADKPRGEVLTAGDKRDLVKKIKTEQTGVMNPVEYEQVKMLARDFIQSGSVPTSYENPEQVVMAILNGRELGMSPVEALNCHYFVNGKLTIYGSARQRQLRKLGWKIAYTDKDWGNDNAECTATVTKDDGEEYSETVSFKDAEDSGYTKDRQNRLKPGWYKGINRKKKLRYLAIDVIIDSYVAEAKGSAVASTEIGMDTIPMLNSGGHHSEPTDTTEDDITEAIRRRQSNKDAKPQQDKDEPQEGEIVEDNA